ncbi:Ankyrin repeat and death domain-containing protein 1A [Takifugu flavidus]|uniref:Ankyrin repeat and death domain-containing protein 1A n=1 Tax=Takifugu flavidus TaxID=433684 RepID=A0A5C6MY50_9TELE|nr:Ankyrin repeat and death domain-containing protein 1A [Takifugu flavidus]
MQRALRVMVEKHRLQRYDPSIPRLGKREHLKEFGDLLLHQHQEKDTDNAFDNNEMLLKAEKQFMEAAKNNDVESMKVVGRGLNVNAKNVNDRTALHYAVAGKNKEAVQFLLQRRIKVDQKDRFGMASIHLAAWFGSLEILKLLVQAGAEQKVENEDGLNIMHCAALNNHTDIVEYIINDLQMKELDKEDNSGNRAFGLAAENGCVDMLEMLLEQYNMDTMKPNLVVPLPLSLPPGLPPSHQAGDTPLHLAASNGHLDAVHLLLLHFDTRDEANAEGETALYQAIDNGHEECALTLLKAGCEPNVFMDKSSVLHPVSERGDTGFVQLLLEYKADTNARNQDQEAPLHLAVKNNHIPVIHCLLTAGCDVNAINKRSQTALHVAADLAKIDVVEMLLKAEFDQTIQDKQGKTVLGVAARADEAIIVDMIIKAERYYAWRKANPELNEPVYSQFPLTFKPDHRVETKQFRSMVWRLAYELLKPADWKRLAEHWGFTTMQMSAIEQQWTGQHSYKEHGNRMLLVWLHGAELAGTSPAKELYQALVSTGNSKAADKIRMEEDKDKSKNCNIS